VFLLRSSQPLLVLDAFQGAYRLDDVAGFAFLTAGYA
jgi:hypothetical protein